MNCKTKRRASPKLRERDNSIALYSTIVTSLWDAIDIGVTCALPFIVYIVNISSNKIVEHCPTGITIDTLVKLDCALQQNSSKRPLRKSTV